MKNANPFEFAARAAKVHALVGAILETLRPSNGFEAGALAAVLTSTSQAERDAFARKAGQRSPSAETWRQVVATVVELGRAYGRAA